MRCKKHPVDHSSSVGVCSSCLRERLFALIAAQAQVQAQLQAQAQQAHQLQEDRRKSDTNPPPLLFPRSVSPYISHRKSDTASATWHHHHHQHLASYHSLPDQKFFSTPQIGPAGSVVLDHHQQQRHKKKSGGRFSLLSGLFRSKSEIPITDSDPRISDSRETSTTTASSSPSWFSSILARRKQNRTFSLDESAIRCHRRNHPNRGRGMSPAIYSDEEEDAEHCQVESNGYTSEEWRQTPRRTPASVGRRGGGRPSQLSRNVSGIGFCLSPLVRASPNRPWVQKGGVPPEVVVPGDIRVPVKHHHSIARPFCKNRSKKLADFGRSNRNH